MQKKKQLHCTRDRYKRALEEIRKGQDLKSNEWKLRNIEIRTKAALGSISRGNANMTKQLHFSKIPFTQDLAENSNQNIIPMYTSK